MFLKLSIFFKRPGLSISYLLFFLSSPSIHSFKYFRFHFPSKRMNFTNEPQSEFFIYAEIVLCNSVREREAKNEREHQFRNDKKKKARNYAVSTMKNGITSCFENGSYGERSGEKNGNKKELRHFSYSLSSFLFIVLHYA